MWLIKLCRYAFAYRWYILLILSATIITMTTWYWMPSHADLAFVQPIVDLTERDQSEDGDPLDVTSEIVNRSREPITITSIAKNCGCITDDVNPGGWVLDPGVHRAIKVRVALRGKSGLNTFALAVEGKKSSSAIPVSAGLAVRTYIEKPLAAIPASYYGEIDEDKGVESIKYTFVLADESRLIDYPPIQFTSSNPDRVRLELRRSHGVIGWTGENPLRKRYELDMTYSPTRDEKDHKEVISVTRPNRKPLEIEVYAKWLPTCSVQPRELIIYGSQPGSIEQRILEYRYKQPAHGNVAVQCDDDAITVEKIGKVDHGWRFRVTCQMPIQQAHRTSVITFRVADNARRIDVPLTVLFQEKSTK